MIYVGAHVSIAKDISLAPVRAKEIGAGAFALFLKNQKVWSAPELKKESVEAFKENLKSLGFLERMVLPHAGYLINLASPKEDMAEKSLTLFKDEIGRAKMLGLKRVNIHPGAYIEGERNDGLRRCAELLDKALEDTDDFIVALEDTAGSGSNLGSSLEELSTIIECAKKKDQIGITLDTCHLYGAGYDIRTKASSVMDRALSLFGKDKIIGMHINDSKAELASHKDRHESLGKGKIGIEAFREIVSHEIAQGIPLILETVDESLWKDEIIMLSEFHEKHIGK